MAKAALPEKAPLHRTVTVSLDHRFEHRAHVVGAGYSAGAQSAPFQVAELVEHEERVTAREARSIPELHRAPETSAGPRRT